MDMFVCDNDNEILVMQHQLSIECLSCGGLCSRPIEPPSLRRFHSYFNTWGAGNQKASVPALRPHRQKRKAKLEPRSLTIEPTLSTEQVATAELFDGWTEHRHIKTLHSNFWHFKAVFLVDLCLSWLFSECTSPPRLTSLQGWHVLY